MLKMTVRMRRSINSNVWWWLDMAYRRGNSRTLFM